MYYNIQHVQCTVYVANSYTVSSALAGMSGEVRRSPRLLERLLTQGSAETSDTPKRSSGVAKRQIQLSAVEKSGEKSSKKRREEDLVDSLVEAFTVDRSLSGLLNLAVYEYGGDDLEVAPEGRLVIVTAKKLHYHEPAGYTSRVRMVLKSTGNYSIQVKLLSLKTSGLL